MNAWVVGSGPAGVSCAKALLDGGHSVTLIDAGLSLEHDNDRHKKNLAAFAPHEWPLASVEALKSRIDADPSGVPYKYVYGSDFYFRALPEAAALEQHGTKLIRSFAQGGLSQAWGATILPFVQEDITDWPVSVQELKPHYEAVMRWMPLSAQDDGLSRSFPLYQDRPHPIALSAQARAILQSLQRHEAALTRKGLSFGQARLAIHGSSGSAKSCRSCGLCLYGCPYDSIYSAAETLSELTHHPRFEYKSGFLVEKVGEDAQGAWIEARALGSRDRTRFRGSRVFLAGGLLNTTQLLADALAIAEPIRMESSQAFMFPFFCYRAAPSDVTQEALHTLSQLYLSIQNPSLSKYRLQLQIYTYNDLMPLVLEKSPLGGMLKRGSRAQSEILKRLVVIQGFLHSQESDPVTWTSLRRADGVSERISLSGKTSWSTRARILRLVGWLAAQQRALGGVPILPWLTLSAPGQSFHNGGSFPMASQPAKKTQTDRWGRPAGMRRVHAVDAAVLPSAPATTITLTIMANAHRIASSVQELE